MTTVKILGIIRTQKIAGQVELRKENKSPLFYDKKVEQSKFSLSECQKVKSTYTIAKELRKEQVEDIMQYMRSQSISKMVQVNEFID